MPKNLRLAAIAAVFLSNFSASGAAAQDQGFCTALGQAAVQAHEHCLQLERSLEELLQSYIHNCSGPLTPDFDPLSKEVVFTPADPMFQPPHEVDCELILRSFDGLEQDMTSLVFAMRELWDAWFPACDPFAQDINQINIYDPCVINSPDFNIIRPGEPLVPVAPSVDEPPAPPLADPADGPAPPPADPSDGPAPPTAE